MTVFEVSTIALIAILAAATTAAIYIGLLNWMGALYVVRCQACHHLTFSTANQPERSCPHCRHPALMHPIYVMHHHSPRVIDDHLRY